MGISPTHVGVNQSFSVRTLVAPGLGPTHVGMNRSRGACRPYTVRHLPHARGDEPRGFAFSVNNTDHLPHARGDEPYYPGKWAPNMAICPTHVGMNRRRQHGRILEAAFAPRTWG